MSLELFHQEERGGVVINAKLNKCRETAVCPGQGRKGERSACTDVRWWLPEHDPEPSAATGPPTVL